MPKLLSSLFALCFCLLSVASIKAQSPEQNSASADQMVFYSFVCSEPKVISDVHETLVTQLPDAHVRRVVGGPSDQCVMVTYHVPHEYKATESESSPEVTGAFRHLFGHYVLTIDSIPGVTHSYTTVGRIPSATRIQPLTRLNMISWKFVKVQPNEAPLRRKALQTLSHIPGVLEVAELLGDYDLAIVYSFDPETGLGAFEMNDSIISALHKDGMTITVSGGGQCP